MLFVVDRPRLLRMVAIVRDDRSPRRGQSTPLVRIAAKDDTVTVSGEKASAALPATVYAPGVLFVPPAYFSWLMRTFAGEKFFTFQMTRDGLLIGNVRLPFVDSDMAYFANPDTAPDRWPPPEPPVPEPEIAPKKIEPSLFPMEEEQKGKMGDTGIVV
jgi:hypothetical protein